jgi:hypothetical protein
VLTDWLRGVDPATPRAASDGPPSRGPALDGFSVDRLLAHRGVWAAGHSVSGTDAVIGVAELVNRLERELDLARQRLLPADMAAGMPTAGCR